MVDPPFLFLLWLGNLGWEETNSYKSVQSIFSTPLNNQKKPAERIALPVKDHWNRVIEAPLWKPADLSGPASFRIPQLDLRSGS